MHGDLGKGLVVSPIKSKAAYIGLVDNHYMEDGKFDDLTIISIIQVLFPGRQPIGEYSRVLQYDG